MPRIIRALLAAGLLLAMTPMAVAVGPPGAPPPAKARAAAKTLPKAEPRFELASPEAVLRWINGYRADPRPQHLGAGAQAMSRLGLFREIDAAAVYIGFMAGVLSANPATAEALVAGMFPMPPDDQVAIVRAIAYSGLPDWKGLLRSFTERMPARKVMIDRYLADKLPVLGKLALDNGAQPVDTLWGFYFGTGSYEPILRIVSILPWSKDANNMERLTIGSMAKWTLANNALRDKELLDMLKGALKHEGKPTAGIVAEIIEAAETFETTKIRKEAMAAIEQLKVKGPENARNYNWWGNAGQTALALGCVVAGALGHFELGIPCIIGGAASTAALKAFAPEQ